MNKPPCHFCGQEFTGLFQTKIKADGPPITVCGYCASNKKMVLIKEEHQDEANFPSWCVVALALAAFTGLIMFLNSL